MRKIDPKEVKKILFISLSNIGDAILTTPCLNLLIQSFPNALISVMVGPRAREVFQDHPAVHQLIIYDKHAPLKEKLLLILKLFRDRYDLVVDLRHTMIPFLVCPKYRTPFFRKKFNGHAVLKHLSVLECLSISGPVSFTLPLLEDHHSMIRETLSRLGLREGSEFIVFNPGAANPLKRWDVEKFKKLGNLIREKNVPIVIIGPSSDRVAFSKIFSEPEWINLCGQLNLMQLGALLKRARLFITNDSGPMHLAVAVGTPVLALFGPTDPRIYGPYGSQHQVVRLELPCSPCMEGFCRIKTQECLKTLEVDRVFSVVKGML